ncbi:hypothetical protein QBC40DRAFT_327611 [Triangularia verruculosa]|uniref:Uncharacterized protein n=1 Tax=Triangularia verruculosa TaxID=2587418 RepID=A0AAN7AWK8_9PEZI|nr:hypothetical protein QBC40DRAFT_327611 [Triangularia verruculosa]
MEDNDFPMGGSEISYSPLQHNNTPATQTDQMAAPEPVTITSESEFWELMARSSPWMKHFNRQDFNWFISVIQDARYDRSCLLQDTSTEDDGRLDSILQGMHVFLERRIIALSPSPELDAGSNANTPTLSGIGTRRLSATVSQQTSRVPSETGIALQQQSEPNRATFSRVASQSTSIRENEGSVTFTSSRHSESGTILVSPSKKRKMRHASGQSIRSGDNPGEGAAACECGRTTPTPLQRATGSFAPPPSSSSFRNRSSSRDPANGNTEANTEHREEHTDTGMVPLPYRVYMCRGEPHLLMPISKFKDNKTTGSSEPVAVANTSSSTTVYINSNVRK